MPSPPFYESLPNHGKALNNLICADVPLRNGSLTHSPETLCFLSCVRKAGNRALRLRYCIGIMGENASV